MPLEERPPRPGASSAQEGLSAGPVADHEERVLVGRVPRGVQQPVTPLGRTLPDPPAVLGVKRRGARLDRGFQPVALGDEAVDRRGPIRLALARVRVVLGHVRGHGRLRLRSLDEKRPVTTSCERSPVTGARSIAYTREVTRPLAGPRSAGPWRPGATRRQRDRRR